MYCYFLCVKYILFAQMQNISIFFGPPQKINSSNARKIISLFFLWDLPPSNNNQKQIFQKNILQ